METFMVLKYQEEVRHPPSKYGASRQTSGYHCIVMNVDCVRGSNPCTPQTCHGNKTLVSDEEKWNRTEGN